MGWADFRSRSFSYHKQKILDEGYPYLDDTRGNRLQLSPRQRRFVGWINHGFNLARYTRRRGLGLTISRLNQSDARMRDGYLLTRLPPPSRAIIAVCERQISIYDSFLKHGESYLAESGIDVPSYLEETAKTESDPLKHVPFLYDQDVANEFIAFALSPMLLAVAARYLGVLPILGSVRILYSPNASSELSQAQLFHLDPEGYRQVKLFMAVREVTKDTGPFTFIPAGLTRRMLESGERGFHKKRVHDADIIKYAPQSAWIENVGKPGDAVFVDTSSCFHFGSRPSKHPRYLLFVQYVDPFCSIFPARDPLKNVRDKWNGYPREGGILTDYILGRKL